MKKLALAFLLATLGTFDAEAATVRFEGYASPGCLCLFFNTPYNEAGLTLFSPDTAAIVSSTAGPPLNNTNGTDVYAWATTTTSFLTATSGLPFTLNSLDAANLVANGNTASLVVQAHLTGGGTVSEILTVTDVWTTFLFTFGSVTSVDFFQGAGPDNIFALDNINATVPVPAALPLFATGLAGLGWLARRRKKQAA